MDAISATTIEIGSLGVQLVGPVPPPAAGLVVVSTNDGGIPYMCENGKNAVLVDVGDWKTLASGVVRLLQNQDLARKLASAGVQLCQQCEWRNVRRALYPVYGVELPQISAELLAARTVVVEITEY